MSDMNELYEIARMSGGKNKVLFIYVANGFEKLKAMNRLKDEDINKIANAYREFKDVEKYAKVVPLKKIKENDYNLSVTRYVDVFEDEETVDILKVLQESKVLEDARRDAEEKLARYLEELGYGNRKRN